MRTKTLKRPLAGRPIFGNDLGMNLVFRTVPRASCSGIRELAEATWPKRTIKGSERSFRTIGRQEDRVKKCVGQGPEVTDRTGSSQGGAVPRVGRLAHVARRGRRLLPSARARDEIDDDRRARQFAKR
jgi:hypothetical protein